ncbi:Protein DMP10 [Cardamine amara subsp. amara]|uniref:Protein DMP10 n=1 Tax=Cardamine amara subsp. amara TaxID=228776 RepID=A0ABD1BYU2_CARAN
MEAAFTRSLPAAGNFVNLLPTGTALMFETLIPSFSNGGECTNKPANKLLTISLISFCAVTCFFSSFTDSFVGEDGRIYYGIATANGLYILNDYPDDGYDPEAGLTVDDKKRRYKMSFVDFVHAFVSVVVFLALAVESSDLRRCLFSGDDGDTWGGNFVIMIKYVAVMVATVASFYLAIFPTKRRGIGFTDNRRN